MRWPPWSGAGALGHALHGPTPRYWPTTQKTGTAYPTSGEIILFAYIFCHSGHDALVAITGLFNVEDSGACDAEYGALPGVSPVEWRRRPVSMSVYALDVLARPTNLAR